ncbi:MAG: hypothetical protein QOD82_7209, partial [Pseudonocardiales bacterium]|nr:hypothetical protein [Pseudonocardiales bacterium]
MNAPPRPHEAGPVTVGVDLGGTGTRIVVLDADGTARRESSSPTTAGISPTRAAAE